MSAEDAVFCAVVHEYGGNWNLASETLAGLPDGGLYRGRYRNPAHCRERFRQLLFKYTSITSAYPMYEKNGASNIPLKVSEVAPAKDFCHVPLEISCYITLVNLNPKKFKLFFGYTLRITSVSFLML